MAGYSKATLVQKLGIKEGAKTLLVEAPKGYDLTLGPLPKGVVPGKISLTKAAALRKAAAGKTSAGKAAIGETPAARPSARNTSATSPAKDGPYDFIQCFCRRGKELEVVLAPLASVLAKTGMLWVSWPKRSAGASRKAIPKEEQGQPDLLDEKAIRAMGLEAGLVDVKVCAVDEVWSGLKFVYRLKDR